MKKILIALCAGVFMLCVAGCGGSQSSASGEVLSVDSAPGDSLSESEALDELERQPYPSAAEEEPEEPVSEFVDYEWELGSPEDHGVDGDVLERLHTALAGVEIRSVVTVKDGVIIDEYYKDGYDESSVFRLASCTKSVSGALIGIAIDRGELDGTEVKLTGLFEQLDAPEQEDKREITVEHLLTHTSGIYWNEWSGGDYFGRLSRSENWVDFVFSQKMSSQPGAVFNYTTGGSHLLGAVIQLATGVTGYEFGLEHLFKPLGMRSVQWSSDPQGITDGGNGISMTARDAAKFGQLYLNGGNWNGTQIISEQWVEQSVKRQAAGSPGTGEYGYSWWLKTFRGYSTYFAMGHGGQYIFVVPELNLVTVMTSRLSDTYTPQYYFNDYVVAACL